MRCRLYFPKQQQSIASDHLQGGKNGNKTRHESRLLKGSIWTELRMGYVSRSWPFLDSAVPIAAGARSLAVVISIFIFRFWGLDFVLIQCCDAGLGCWAASAANVPSFLVFQLETPGWSRALVPLQQCASVSLPMKPRCPLLGTALMHAGTIRRARNHSVVHVWDCRPLTLCLQDQPGACLNEVASEGNLCLPLLLILCMWLNPKLLSGIKFLNKLRMGRGHK